MMKCRRASCMALLDDTRGDSLASAKVAATVEAQSIGEMAEASVAMAAGAEELSTGQIRPQGVPEKPADRGAKKGKEAVMASAMKNGDVIDLAQWRRDNR